MFCDDLCNATSISDPCKMYNGGCEDKCIHDPNFVDATAM